MASASIKCTRPDGHPHVLLITIDRPPVNAMSLAAHRELLAALRSVEDDSDIRCIVLTGAGNRSFVAGGDVDEEILFLGTGHLALEILLQLFFVPDIHNFFLLMFSRKIRYLNGSVVFLAKPEPACNKLAEPDPGAERRCLDPRFRFS